jgi:Phosphotransferase enzyme family
MRENSLRGGSVSGVARVGDTVRRRPGVRAGFVHELLGFFQRSGWSGAPRFLGFDEQGREILSFMEGYVAWRADALTRARVSVEASLAGVAELVREFHDLTAGTSLAGDQEVVCHNDLAPKNTVYDDGGAPLRPVAFGAGYGDGGAGVRPVAFIDWDLAAPGRRIDDVAHMCWQYLGLGPGTETEPAARRIQLICDAYRLEGRDEIVDVIMWWQDRCWRGIQAGAEAGDPAMLGLRDRGAVRDVRAAWRWVAEHRGELEGR